MTMQPLDHAMTDLAIALCGGIHGLSAGQAHVRVSRLLDLMAPMLAAMESHLVQEELSDGRITFIVSEETARKIIETVRGS